MCEKLQLARLVGRFGFLGRMQAQTGHMCLVPTCDLNAPPAGMFEHGANGRNLLGQNESETAKRIDRFLHLGEPWIDPVRYVVKLRAGVAIPHALADGGYPYFRGVVMLVLDLANDFLD